MFEQVKQEIDDKIKTNGNNEITANRLNGVLQDMMDASAEVIEEVQQSIGDQVEANPTEDPTDTLEKIKIGEGVFKIPQTDTSDLVTEQELQQTLNSYVQKTDPPSPAAGDLVAFDQYGGFGSSGKKVDDFATAEQGAKADNAQPKMCINKKSIYLGVNILDGITGSGTGWNENAGVYTHANGNSDALVFDLSAVTGYKSGDAYVVIFSAGAVNKNITCAVGDSYDVSVYNEGTGPYYSGFVVDGGNLKINVPSTYTSTIFNVEMRNVVNENTQGATLYQLSVYNSYDSEKDDLTSWWNVSLGALHTFENAENVSRSIAVGNYALRSEKSGTRNIAIGTFAMEKMENGHYNVAIGADALYCVKNAEGNVSIGASALGATYTPATDYAHTNNVAIGRYAGDSVCQGQENNVCIGNQAGFGDTENKRSNNVAIGTSAGRFAKENNVCIGNKAGYYDTGSSNIFIGLQAQQRQYVTTSHSIVIGEGAHVGNAISSPQQSVLFSIAIGYRAEATKSKQIVIGNPTDTNAYTEMQICLAASGKFIVNLGGVMYQLVFNNDNTVTWTTPS